MTLILSPQTQLILFADRLNYRDIRVKFNKSRSNDSGDMEQTRNSKVNLLTLKFYLVAESWAVFIDSLRETFE